MLLLTILVLAATAAVGQVGPVQRITLPVDQQLTLNGQILSVSPDGTRFVYAANHRLYSKTFDSQSPTVIPGTESSEPVVNPIFSPDGRELAFWSAADKSIERIPIAGGKPVMVCKTNDFLGMNWEQNDVIVFAVPRVGIQRVPASGGTPETIATLKDGEFAYGPRLLSGSRPGREAVLFTLIVPASAGADIWDKAQIVLQPIGGGERKILINAGSDARLLPDGHLLYSVSGSIWSVPFDEKEFSVRGNPAKVLGDVRVGGQAGPGRFSISANGTLVVVPRKTGRLEAALVSRDGKRRPIGFFPDWIFAPRLSPDGKRVTFDGDGNIWTAELSNLSGARRLTTTGRDNFPLWIEGGKQIAFISSRDGDVQSLFRQSAEGTGDAELLVKPARAPESWVQASERFSFITLKGNFDYDVWTYSLRDRKAQPLIEAAMSAQKGSHFSNDGRWIAWESDEDGKNQVYAESYPPTGAKFRIAKQGVFRPEWSPGDREIFIDDGVQLFAVPVMSGADPRFGDPVPLPIRGFIQGPLRRQYDMMPDGKQFLMMFPIAPEVDVMTDWVKKAIRSLGR